MKKVHFLGIGGSGASAAAAIAQNMGYEVTGCDLKPHNEFTTVFKNSQIFEGHNPNHLENIDLLVVTPAIFSLDPENPELQMAKNKNIPILTWQEFTGEYLAKDKFVIAVSGTHGKTTTTAMIAKVLEDAGLNPTVLLGAVCSDWGGNYRVGSSKYFIIEADEFNDNFLAYKPNIAVVTSIEMDHPEYFKDFDTYKESFKKFLSSAKEKIIANLSDRGVKEVLAFQGETLEAQAKIIDYSEKIIDFPLQVPGEYNILNASAAYQVGLSLKIEPKKIKKSLMNYQGICRRFECVGEYKGAEVYSDFGHHPTEIKVTLGAAREKFPDKKITVIFQPHMFSRTKALFKDFVEVLKNLPVDRILISDIFPSREIDKGEVSSKELVEAINKESVIYIPEEKVLELIKKEVKPQEILFFLGAGDTDELAKKLVQII